MENALKLPCSMISITQQQGDRTTIMWKSSCEELESAVAPSVAALPHKNLFCDDGESGHHAGQDRRPSRANKEM